MSDRLTPKQDKFVEVYLNTGNATEAYRQSYSCSGMKETTINREAFALLENHKITARLGVLKERAAAKAVLTRAWIIEELMDNAKKAKGAEDFIASNKALELLGKTDEMRMFVERSESDNRHDHKVSPVSAFDDFLKEAAGTRAEGDSEGPVPN